jgi:hypothetical protein
VIKSLLGALTAVGLSQAAVGATYFTTKCSQFGQPEFQFSASNSVVPQVDVDWLIRTLEGMVASGEKFKIGETIQLGWMITKLESGDKGSLKITEPDMKSFPIKFVDSVDSTLRVTRSQKDVVESVLSANDIAFPNLVQSVVVHKNYKQARQIVLQRLPSSGSDSGWRLLDQKDSSQDPKQFIKISLYQLALDRPNLVMFLALPTGVQVAIDGRVVILRDGAELRVKPDSFLNGLNKKGFSP